MDGTEGGEEVGGRGIRERYREASGLSRRTIAMFSYRFLVGLRYFSCLPLPLLVCFLRL